MPWPAGRCYRPATARYPGGRDQPGPVRGGPADRHYRPDMKAATPRADRGAASPFRDPSEKVSPGWQYPAPGEPIHRILLDESHSGNGPGPLRCRPTDPLNWSKDQMVAAAPALTKGDTAGYYPDVREFSASAQGGPAGNPPDVPPWGTNQRGRELPRALRQDAPRRYGLC